MLKIRDNYHLIYENIVETFRQYLNDNNLKSLIIGLSGGIDSALTAALAYEALKEIDGIELIGRSIPIETNKDDEIDRGEKIGINFCNSFEVKDLTETYFNLHSGLVSEDRKKDSSKDEKIRCGNIKARVRMIYLFDLAHFHKGMVLSTDNYTELLLGFWTLHGDVGNYGMIQYLWKTEVYGLSRFLVDRYRQNGQTDKADSLALCIDATPTDGLGITNSDFDQIGVKSYEEADQLLIDYIKGNKDNIKHPVIERCIKSKYKRVDPQNIARDILLKK